MGQIRDRMHQDLVRGGYSHHTVRQYLACAQQVIDFFDGRPPSKIGPIELRAFVDDVQSRGLSWQRVRQYLAAIKFLFGTTLGRPEDVTWVMFPQEKRKVPVVLSGTEIERLLAAITSPTVYAVACTLYGAGLRVDEALHLEVTDVLGDRGLLHVRTAKGGHERNAMLSPRLLTILRDYWRKVRPTPPLLFAGQKPGKAIHAETVRVGIRAATIEAKIGKRVTPHTMRHSFATHQLELGIELRVIQQLLGHASIRSTGIYAHVNSDVVRRTPSPLDVLGTDAAKVLG